MTENASGFWGFWQRINSPDLRAIVEVWGECRGRHRFPSWPQLEAQLPAIGSERIWAFDYNRDIGEFTARFAGNTAMIGFGKSFRGTRLRDLHPPHLFDTAQASLMRVLSEPACCRWSGKLLKIGNQIVQGERIILPVGSDDGLAEGVFGASDFDYTVTQTPDRLELIHDVADWCPV